jgi:hypothetical protein
VHLAAIAVASSALISAQAPAPAASRAVASPAQPAPLPVRRVVLYKTGVGYFEHLGTVRGAEDITIRFTSAQLNDVLKSLTAIDLGKGQITSISYNSTAPLDQRLASLRLPVSEHTTLTQLLSSLKGARVEVGAGGAAVSGRLLGIETRNQQRGDRLVEVPLVSIVTDTGDLRSFELSSDLRVRVADRDMRQEIGRYLDVVGSTREQDVRNMVISTAGSGERRLFVSYISEVPIWKSTYRLVFPDQGKPLLQGWAIVDNTIGEDWRNVELSLVAGAPQSFIQDLSQPYYGQRPVVPLPPMVLVQPQTHAATLRRGRGTLNGTVRDQAGAAIPGATIELHPPAGEVLGTVSDADGEYEIDAPGGEYRMRVALSGFRAVVMPVIVPAGDSRTQDVTLQVGGVSETVTVSGVAAGLPRADALAPPPPPAPSPAAPLPTAADVYAQMKEAAAAATGSELGELFEYRIKEPVTLLKNQSALVPIVNGEITAERVSLWDRGAGHGRPLRAMWLTNTTTLTLDGGSMTIVDGNAFAGEGLIEPLTPNERRLVSYASDLSLLVNAGSRAVPRRLSRVTARDGIIVQESQERSTTTYEARNEGTAAATLLIEHPIRAGWTIAGDPKPVESTPGAARFRMTVDPGREATLAVSEQRPGTVRVRIADANEKLIADLAASGVSADVLQSALGPVLRQRAELAAIDRRLADIEAERARISADQQRLRENMKALRGSAEERQLLQRYTRQLDEQEDRLAALQQDSVKAAAERSTASTELSRLIAAVSFDWAAK